MRNKNIILIFTILIISTLEAKDYHLYIASTKYENISRNYIEEINDILQVNDLIVRTHKKGNFSVLVQNINTIEKAKKLQHTLNKTSRYKDSYIKEITNKPLYSVLYQTVSSNSGKFVINKKEKNKEEYKHKIESSNEYITASTMYNIGNYKKSYALFSKLFYKYNYNVNVNYFLSQSAIKVKKYDEASAALERVLIQKPKFHKARYEYAKLLFKLRIKDEAKKEFNTLLKSNINTKTKTEIQKYLQVLNKKKKYSNKSANILIGMGRSSNVNNGLLTEQYRLPGLDNIIVSGEKPIPDTFHNEALSLNFINILKKYPQIRIRNSFFIYNKNYLNEKDENTTVIGYKPSLSYLYNRNIYSLDFNLNRINRKNKESFNFYSITPNIKNQRFLISSSYQRAQYLSQINAEKDFNKIDLFLEYTIFKNLKIHSKYAKVTREENKRIDIDRKIANLGFNTFYKINNKNMLNFEYEIARSKYKYENILFNSKRKDKNHYLNLSYIYSLDNKDRIAVSSSYTRNKSNQDAYDYKEKELKINYLKQFNW